MPPVLVETGRWKYNRATFSVSFWWFYYWGSLPKRWHGGERHLLLGTQDAISRLQKAIPLTTPPYAKGFFIYRNLRNNTVVPASDANSGEWVREKIPLKFLSC